MQSESGLYRLMHVFSPTGWLVVVIVSVVLAGGSAVLLAVRSEGPQNQVPGRAFDTVEQFVRDTIRLTFKDRAMSDASDAIFVAPKGILNKDATFNWIEKAQENESHSEAVAPLAIAPARLLEPDWEPIFAAPPDDRKKNKP